MKIPNIAQATLACLCLAFSPAKAQLNLATTDDGQWLFVDTADVPAAKQHLNHEAMFKKYVKGYNISVLKAVDIVQSHAMDGGGYFIGISAKPTESPIGYQLSIFQKPLLDPPRTTSYCSGSSYGVFIEALNLIFPDGGSRLSSERLESLHMQEPDGSRREDRIKFWGKWNDDGWGTHYALVQYSGMGEEITPQRARPGDFMNISWVKGLGHSVVFLGWFMKENKMGMIFWSSQKSTNGYSDVVLWPLSNVKSVKTVRMTHPEKVFSFDVEQTVKRDLPGDTIVPPQH
jgi:hypothetical protein